MKKLEFGEGDLKSFAYALLSQISSDSLPVFLCVGSDKFICDSLGPMVGEILTKKYNIKGYVYGDLEYNINANNLSSAVNYIETYHRGSQIILIDCTLAENVGSVILTEGSFAGLGKTLPIQKLGQISILGVIGKRYRNFDLNSTRMQVVVGLAKFIAKGIAMALSVSERRRIFRCQNLLKIGN